MPAESGPKTRKGRFELVERSMEQVPPVGGAGIVCDMCFGARNNCLGRAGKHGAKASPCGGRRTGSWTGSGRACMG